MVNSGEKGKINGQSPDECEQQPPPPPDGGWGWVVVFASFMIHVVTDGVVYSFGELFKEFLSYYKAGNGLTSLIPSILVGTTLCSGPIASALVNKFGCRPVTITGSIISAICIVISVFANSVVTLMITIGFGTGIGFGLIYLPAIVSVTCYFDKYRSIATGIGVCGSGFGTVIFAPLVKVSIRNFGLEGTLLVIAGMVLTCIFYGYLLRPLPVYVEVPKRKTDEFYAVESEPPANITILESCATANGNAGNERCCSIPDVPTAIDKAKLHVLRMSNSQFVSQPSLNKCKLNSSSLSLHSSSSAGVMYRKDVFCTGSIRSIKDESRSNGYLPCELVQVTIPSRSEDDSKICGCAAISKECTDTFAEMTDFSLLADVIFVLFAASNFLTSIGFNIPYIFIPSQVEEKHYASEWSSYLLSFIGFGNTAGRIILGYISDKPWVNRLFIYNTCLTLCGVSCLLSVFCRSPEQNVIFAVIYGFTTGAYVGLTSVITVDLFGLDKLTNAFGMILLYQGIASFIGPPLAGVLCDHAGSYDPAFILTGISIGLSGLMLYSVPSLKRYLNKRKLRKPIVKK